jgi:lipoate-protein ligase A
VHFEFSVEACLDGYINMARDAEILALAETGRATCRVYAWDGAWVSLGRYQSAERDLVPGSAVPWVMRPTGGKAVLHGHDITVGFARPVEAGEVRSIRQLYRSVTAPLIRALRECGLPATLGEQTPFVSRGVRVADCFAHVSANDIVDERTGLKVCGCALRVTDRAVLLQASIPTRPALVDPATVIKGGKAVGAFWEGEPFADALALILNGTRAAV